MVDAFALLLVAAFFGYAAFNGTVKSSGKETYSLLIEAAPFLAGAGVIWLLWQIPSWREPVAIFTAIILITLAMNSYKNVNSELSNALKLLAPSSANAANAPVTGVQLP